MRACEADRCESPATIEGRWCERHARADERVHRLVEIQHDADGGPFIEAQVTRADVTPEYALEAPYDWAPEWWQADQYVTVCETNLQAARSIRTEVLHRMRRTGMSLGDIAEVTGLTRQRIGQLLR